MSSPTPPPRALLLSVGGSSAPLLHSLHTHHPTHVAYFCSAGTRGIAEQIHQVHLAQPRLGQAPLADYLEASTHEELGPCYASLRNWLPRWLRDRGLEPEHVTVDYTGGTKTLSAALVLAASECFQRFSYVGGAQRDGGGTGAVLAGTERVHAASNPWRELAVRELEQAERLWDLQQFGAVAALLKRTSRQVPRERRDAFTRIADLASAMEDRLALQLPSATDRLSKLAAKLDRHPPPTEAPVWPAHQELSDFCRRAIVRLGAAEALRGPAVDKTAQLRELLDNALLTARLGRHDDGAARLYRALELFGQNELTALTNGAFSLGRLRPGVALPAAVASFALFAGPEGLAAAHRGIALEQVYRLLAHLGHEAGRRAVAEFDGPNAAASDWRRATIQRNQSILAHGLQPVGESGFRSLAALVGSYVGQSTAQVDLEAPAFRLAWFAW